MRRASCQVLAIVLVSICSSHSLRAQETPPVAPAQPGEPLKADRTLNPQWVAAMQWRSIGPASMGGRVVDLEVVAADPSTFYVATASGGLFKTTNNGNTFTPQFQHENTVSIGDACLAPSDANILWIGTGENNARNSVSWGDGVYKSLDGGKTWKNMGLEKSYQIGRIAIHPTDPNIVYVGALGRLWGENEERGVYKTIDGGQTWEKVLYVDPRTGCIDIALSPSDPDTILAAMYERQRDEFDLGDPVKRWGAGSRIYKSTDGGRNWKPIKEGLPTAKLGRIGLCYYAKDPRHVYAVVETEQGGTAPAGSKFPAYMGMDGADVEGGARLTTVVKDGPAEKAGLKVGDVVFAIDETTIKTYADLTAQIRKHNAGDEVTVKARRGDEEIEVKLKYGDRTGASTNRRPFGTNLGGQLENVQEQQGPSGFETGGVFKSVDGGESWTRINSLNPRPFYFSKIRVDPNDERYLYVLGISLYRSSDGGVTLRPDAGRGVHADHHAMWIDPRDSRHILLGCDGGLNITHDRCDTWEFVDNLPIGQFYHVGVDTRLMYNVYGGLQDNGSWGGPSALRGSIGPTTDEWFPVGGGDGYLCKPDPLDPDLVYFESQYGRMGRVNLRTGERASIRPQPDKGETLRFNWKTPFLLSNHNSKIFYCAGNRVYKSLDRGEVLRAISPNITRTEKGTATELAESPVNPDVLYAGTDDGWLWITKSGGHDWTQLNVAGLPGPRGISSIEASRHAEGRCYVVFDGHRNNDEAPYVFVTEDFGQNWTSLRANLPIGSTRVLREDPTNADLLYLGTEFGIWASLDRGKDWTRLNSNLPTVAVHEVAIHPTAGEIVAATHGRSLWVLDVVALRQMTPKALAAPGHLFEPRPATLWGGPSAKRLKGQKRFVGENPYPGAVFYYTLREKGEQGKLKVTDIDGRTLAQLPAKTTAGLHRLEWNLRRPPQRRSGGGQGTPGARVSPLGERIEPGVYRVTLEIDGQTWEQKLKVSIDPQYPETTLTLEEEDALRKIEKTEED